MWLRDSCKGRNGFRPFKRMFQEHLSLQRNVFPPRKWRGKKKKEAYIHIHIRYFFDVIHKLLRGSEGVKSLRNSFNLPSVQVRNCGCVFFPLRQQWLNTHCILRCQQVMWSSWIANSLQVKMSWQHSHKKVNWRWKWKPRWEKWIHGKVKELRWRGR